MRPAHVIGAAVLALLLSVAAITQADPDLWGHVRFGIDILETRELPEDDPYSFTQDRPWINHEWLSELTMGAAWRIGGTPGLTLLKALLAVAALAVVWRGYRGADVGWQIAAAAAAAVAGAQIVQTIRPQNWSLLAIALLGAQLSSRGAGRPWMFFLLFCAWANAHGGWIVGLGVVSVWALVETLGDRARWRPWAIAVGASVLGTLATPYGWRLWAFMLETVRLTRPQIEDWLPLWSVGPEKWILWALIAAWSAWFLPRVPRRRTATTAVLIALAAASVKVVRILPLFGVASVVLLAPAVASWRPRRALTPLKPGEERLAAAVIAAVCLAGAAWAGSSSFRCIGVDRSRMPDPAIVKALSDAPPGRMVTYFNWGEYALWHLGPEIRVSMDGRRETVYSDRRLAEHDAILYGRPEGLALLAEWKPEYVWLPAESMATREWLARKGYRLDLEAARSFLAIRGDLPAIAPRPTRPATSCFPD